MSMVNAETYTARHHGGEYSSTDVAGVVGSTHDEHELARFRLTRPTH